MIVSSVCLCLCTTTAAAGSDGSGLATCGWPTRYELNPATNLKPLPKALDEIEIGMLTGLSGTLLALLVVLFVAPMPLTSEIAAAGMQ